MALDDCQLIQLPRIQDPRGNLTFVEGNRHVPFEIKRVFYLYDVPGGESRKTIHLNRAYQAILVPPAIWRELENFSSGAVCLVLASEPYSEGAYYREYEEYRRAVRASR